MSRAGTCAARARRAPRGWDDNRPARAPPRRRGRETRPERDAVKLHTLRLSAAAYFVFFCFSIIICLTIFCSSMRNARTTRCRTHLAQRLPPYARDTVRSRLCVFL